VGAGNPTTEDVTQGVLRLLETLAALQQAQMDRLRSAAAAVALLEETRIRRQHEGSDL
jgi:hypothetical protein